MELMLTLLVHIIDFSKEASCYILNMPYTTSATATITSSLVNTANDLSNASSKPIINRRMTSNPQQISPGKKGKQLSTPQQSDLPRDNEQPQNEAEYNKYKLSDESMKKPPILYILSVAASNKNCDVILGN